MGKLLYKYYRINEYLFDMLISNQLYFSSTSQFNDPYDCHFTIKELPSLESYELFWKGMDIEKEQYESLLTLYKQEPEKSIAPILNMLKSQLSYYGICCFAGSKENFLMWSHYADSHKGVCLGFDYNELTKQYTQFDNVEYDNAPYFFDINDTSTSLSKAVLRKSADWRYEEETRFVMERSKSWQFDMGTLKEVNFGLKTRPRQMMTIIHLIGKLGYPNCSFYKGNIAKSNYSVGFDKVNVDELKKSVLKESEKIPFKMDVKLR